MSVDRSLKVGGGLAQHRNVLTRPERAAKLAEKGKFDWEAGNPLNLPKVINRRVAAGAKAKKKEKAAEADAAVAAPAAKAPAGKAPAGKAPAAKAPAAKGGKK